MKRKDWIFEATYKRSRCYPYHNDNGPSLDAEDTCTWHGPLAKVKADLLEIIVEDLELLREYHGVTPDEPIIEFYRMITCDHCEHSHREHYSSGNLVERLLKEAEKRVTLLHR